MTTALARLEDTPQMWTVWLAMHLMIERHVRFTMLFEMRIRGVA